jgi:hypothetical protein
MKLLRAYARAYRDCFWWLYRWCPPWRWLLGAAFLDPRQWVELKFLMKGTQA